MKFYRNLRQVGAGLLAATQLAQAVVIYETYDTNNAQSDANGRVSYNTGTGIGDRQAVSFLTPDQAYTLDSVTLYLSGLAPDSAAFRLTLCDDLFEHGVHRPGANLGALTTPTAIFNPANVSFTAAALSLQPNTRYWVVAEPSLIQSSIFFWYEGSSASGYLSSSRDNGPWSPWSEVPDASLSIVVHATPVPEPATWGVIAALLAAVAGPLLRGRFLA